MQGKFTKDSAEFKMFGDFFNLCKEFWGVEESREYWESIVNKTDEFIKKYETDTKGFSKRLGYALLCQQEKIYYDTHQASQKGQDKEKKGVNDKITTKKKQGQ